MQHDLIGVHVLLRPLKPSTASIFYFCHAQLARLGHGAAPVGARSAGSAGGASRASLSARGAMAACSLQHLQNVLQLLTSGARIVSVKIYRRATMMARASSRLAGRGGIAASAGDWKLIGRGAGGSERRAARRHAAGRGRWLFFFCLASFCIPHRTSLH